MKQVFPATIQSGASQTGNYILMLLEPESNIQIPILIGQHEAQSILLTKEDARVRRPLTHRTMKQVMEAFGLTLNRVTIDRVHEGVFYSTLHISDGFNEKQIDSRTSDAVALALHTNAPIFADEKVIEETGVRMENEESRTKHESLNIETLEEELRQCEEAENYERAAEIQQKIDQLRNEL